ncbi:F-box only protein 6-like [Conger conger]|uniref:F-box only protein 6-like n=1 Tax=Conger conger TaxID=82655 RepID=UPI002A59D638|nr:F-box only protein 6-like [Conger conger]
MAGNLIKNPCGQENMAFWAITANGGDKWRVDDISFPGRNDFLPEVMTKTFVTSFGMCLKKQVVDLLAAGFLPDALDAQPPVTVKDWYSGRTDCGCTYQLTVCLLDENKEILQKFEPSKVTLEKKDGDSWRKVTRTFSQYGPGLRFISFEHGGQDTQYWKGSYGVRVTGSSVIVEQHHP